MWKTATFGKLLVLEVLDITDFTIPWLTVFTTSLMWHVSQRLVRIYTLFMSPHTLKSNGAWSGKGWRGGELLCRSHTFSLFATKSYIEIHTDLCFENMMVNHLFEKSWYHHSDTVALLWSISPPSSVTQIQTPLQTTSQTAVTFGVLR